MKSLAAAILLGCLAGPTCAADDPPPSVRFDRIVIDADLADAYQVEVADVDGDKKPDIVALGNNTIAWYQNPTWTKRIIGDTKTSPLKADIISSATADLDGDGRAEVAIACDFAMNTPTRGQLFLASPGATLADPWTFRLIKDVPSIHRLRWNDFQADNKPELVVAPIFGPGAKPPTYDQDLAQVVVFRPDPTHPKTGDWQVSPVIRRPVVHAVSALPAINTPTRRRVPASLITADNTGLSRVLLIPGEEANLSGWEETARNPIPGKTGPAPKRGCSDAQLGRAGGPFVVTIEPWHGSELVIWVPRSARSIPPPGTGALERAVIDDSLDQGHALWTADVDGDGTDEIFAGHRGKDHRVAMYRLQEKTWNRTIIDADIAAQDLRGGDLDGDGVPDIVAVGGTTHNVVWYHPIRTTPAATR